MLGGIGPGGHTFASVAIAVGFVLLLGLPILAAFRMLIAALRGTGYKRSQHNDKES